MKTNGSVTYIVDADPQSRRDLANFLDSFGMETKTFASAAEYITFRRDDLAACLVLDLQLADINGLELQTKLVHGDSPPIVFISEHGDISSCVRAMRNGALEFLTKPINEKQLLAALELAFERDKKNRTERREVSTLKTRLNLLTRRELEVFRFVVNGYLNKQAAAEMGITETTMQVHRGRVMKKMGATSLANLVRMSTKLETLCPQSEEIYARV